MCYIVSLCVFLAFTVPSVRPLSRCFPSQMDMNACFCLDVQLPSCPYPGIEPITYHNNSPHVAEAGTAFHARRCGMVQMRSALSHLLFRLGLSQPLGSFGLELGKPRVLL